MTTSMHTDGNGTTTTTNDINTGGCTSVHQDSAMGHSDSALKHKVDVSYEWTRDEQSLLEELLAKYASDSKVLRLAKIAIGLNDKTVRDVALRCRWMTKKENGKRRKDNNKSSKKDKRITEKVADQQAKPTSHATNDANGSVSMDSSNGSVSMDSANGVSYRGIGGVHEHLLEQNAKDLDQISANLYALEHVDENMSLLCRVRDNIITILNDLNNMPGPMMPIPMILDMDLANSILQDSSL